MGVVVFFGIWFFARTGTVSVVIQIPIDTTDPALTFFLNENRLEAESLSAPIELKPGDYELVVNRDGKLFKKFFFSVSKEETGPIIAKEIPIPPPPPPPEG